MFFSSFNPVFSTSIIFLIIITYNIWNYLIPVRFFIFATSIYSKKRILALVWGADFEMGFLVKMKADWLGGLEPIGMSKGFTGGGKRAIGYRTAPAKIIENDFLSPRGVRVGGCK